MAIYATGTTGYIGSKARNSIPLNIDLRDTTTYSQLHINPNSTVIHLAAIVGAQRVLENPQSAYAVNVSGTIQFAKNILHNTNSRFLFVSTSQVYKYTGNIITEDSPLAPSNIYAMQKLEAENSLRELFAPVPERLLVVRVFSLLGPAMPKGTLGWAIERASSQIPVRFSSDLRDFSSAVDVAAILENLARRVWKYSTINVCSGTCQSVKEAGFALRGSLGLKTYEQYFTPGHSSIPKVCGDNSRMKESLIK
jgi:nucleoside-diphosphate-sugar epimerase